MKLLIRSQSGNSLLNLNCTTGIGLNEGLGGFLLVAVANGKEYKIAKYSTEQKALNVLDMIEEHYDEPIYHSDIGSGEIAEYRAKTFKMPADDEVEVEDEN